MTTTIGHLFLVFLKIGLFSIGGGYAIMPAIREQVVERSGWISTKMFTDIITISQMTPGPLAVNTSTFVGLQIGGIQGAVTATVGCVIGGITISLFLYCFFRKNNQSSYVFEVLNGLKSASLGLILSAAVTMMSLAFLGTGTVESAALFASIHWKAILLFVCMLMILRKWKLNPILLMLISGVAGFIIYR